MVSSGSLTVVIDSAFSQYLPRESVIAMAEQVRRLASRGPLVAITRRAQAPGPEFPCAIQVSDLTRPWNLTFAESDILCERTRWLGGPQ